MADTQKHLISFNLDKELEHGICVSNLAYQVGKQLKLQEEECYQLAVAGMLHDIGKLRLCAYLAGNDMVVEEIKYVRRHPVLGYESLKGRGYSDFVMDSVRYHHENYDGSGYPENLSGESIPFGARVLRVCDVYAALTSKRPYRDACSTDAAVKMMIEEIKNFDMRIFLAFQRAVHENDCK